MPNEEFRSNAFSWEKTSTEHVVLVMKEIPWGWISKMETHKDSANTVSVMADSKTEVLIKLANPIKRKLHSNFDVVDITRHLINFFTAYDMCTLVKKLRKRNTRLG